MERPAVVVILVGAGAGARLGGEGPKALRSIGGRALLAHAALGASACPGLVRLVAVVPAGSERASRSILTDLPMVPEVVSGGDTRQGSVRAGLASVPDDVAVVLVHDVARPFASADLFGRVVEVVAAGADAVAPVLPVTDTVLRVRGGVVAGLEPRNELCLAQTPQGFRARALREAHAKADAAGLAFTDDASLLRWAGFEVRTVEGEPDNAKITTAADLAAAERHLGGVGG